MPQRNQLVAQVLPAHSTQKLPTAPATSAAQTGEALVNPRFAMRGTRRFAGPAPRDDTPAKHGRPTRRRGDERGLGKARQRSHSGLGSTEVILR